MNPEMPKSAATVSTSLDSPVAGFPFAYDKRKPGGTPGEQCTPKIDGDAAGGFAEQSADNARRR